MKTSIKICKAYGWLGEGQLEKLLEFDNGNEIKLQLSTYGVTGSGLRFIIYNEL